MSEFSGRLQYDDRQSEEDEAVADSCTFLAYRRLAASRGKAHRDMCSYKLACEMCFRRRCGGNLFRAGHFVLGALVYSTDRLLLSVFLQLRCCFFAGADLLPQDIVRPKFSRPLVTCCVIEAWFRRCRDKLHVT